jgi:low affinity Fe/Cu permease
VALSDTFAQFAKWTARVSGRPATFLLAALVIVVWAVTGPIFHFSDTWQLVINTGTTIVTFLMVFLIQNTQNRDAVAMQIKLDELIRAVRGAHNAVVDLEDSTEQELEEAKRRYEALAKRARARARLGQEDTGQGPDETADPEADAELAEDEPPAADDAA